MKTFVINSKNRKLETKQTDPSILFMKGGRVHKSSLHNDFLMYDNFFFEAMIKFILK